MRISLLALAIAAMPTLARADQCIAVDADTAAHAAKLLKGATVVHFCEPCHADAPSAPKTNPTVAVVDDSVIARGKAIRLDGTEVDLAYTYVQTGTSTFTNVGLMVGCSATGVTPFINPAAPRKATPEGKPSATQPCDPLTHMHGCGR